jgi:hypothetical protein
MRPGRPLPRSRPTGKPGTDFGFLCGVASGWDARNHLTDDRKHREAIFVDQRVLVREVGPEPNPTGLDEVLEPGHNRRSTGGRRRRRNQRGVS